MADVNRLVYLVLIIGMSLSVTLLAAGLTLTYGLGMEPTGKFNLLSELYALVQGSAEPKPTNLLCLGILVLVLTPTVRILVCTLVFLANRDLRFAFLSLSVLSIIILSAVMSVLLGVRPAA